MRIENVNLEDIQHMSKQELCDTFACEEITAEQLEEIKKHYYFLRTEESCDDDYDLTIVLIGNFFDVKVV